MLHPMQADRPRLGGLDALRGVAALSVVIWHVNLHDLLGTAPFETHAYLAVDLFFMLSGFVMGQVYGAPLSRGEGLGRFLRARLTRLWPLHLAGLLLGFLAFVVVRTDEARGVGGGLLLLLALAAAFLPWMFGGAARQETFPFNPPSWSLSVELWGNLAYGLIAPRLGRRVLGGCILAGAGLLVWTTVWGAGLNHGWRQFDLPVGWARFLFAFPVGVGLQRLWASGRIAAGRLPDWLPALVLAAMLFAPATDGPWSRGFDLLAVLAVFPVLILAGAGAHGGTAASGVLALGARLSYPLYAVHTGAVRLAAWAFMALHLGGAPRPLKAFALLAAALLAAWAAERFFDRPLRAWVGRRGAKALVVRSATGARRPVPTGAS